MDIHKSFSPSFISGLSIEHRFKLPALFIRWVRKLSPQNNSIPKIDYFCLISGRSNYNLSQVKRNLIASTVNLVYELPHEFPNALRKLGNIRKVSNLIGHSLVSISHSLVSILLWKDLIFGINSLKITRKSRCQTILVMSSFTGDLYFIVNFLSGVV